MKRRLLLGAAAGVLLAGCATANEEQVLDDGDMHVEQARAQPGEIIEISFPEGHLRPGVVTIHSFDGQGRWEHTYNASTGRLGDQAMETVAAAEEPWDVELAPADDEPDPVLLPDEMEPGDHRVCATTEDGNASTTVCEGFEVVD